MIDLKEIERVYSKIDDATALIRQAQALTLLAKSDAKQYLVGYHEEAADFRLTRALEALKDALKERLPF